MTPPAATASSGGAHPVKRELLRLFGGVASSTALLVAVYFALDGRVQRLERMERDFHVPALALSAELNTTLVSMTAPPGVAASYVENLDSENVFIASVTRDAGRARALLQELASLHRAQAHPDFASALRRVEQAQAELAALDHKHGRDPWGLARAMATEPQYATIVSQQLSRLHTAANNRLHARQREAQGQFLGWFAIVLAGLLGGLVWQTRRSLSAIDGILGQERRAVEALGASRAELSDAQALARLGSWQFDLRSGAWTWSDEMYGLCECSPAACRPSTEGFVNLVHPLDRARVSALLQDPSPAALAAFQGYRMQFWDGRVKHVLSHVRLDADAQGRPARLFGTAQDVSDKFEAEQRVRASQDRLAAVLAAVPELWFVIDAHGCFQEVSHASHPDLDGGWPAACGRPCTLVGRDGEPAVAAELLRRALHGQQVQTLEYEVAGARGLRAFEARIAPMPAGLSLYLSRDITERKLAERMVRQSRDELELLVADRTRQLTLARDQAEHANQAKSEFLSRMSHELRTPMNAVLGFAQLLALDRELRPKSQEYLDHILRAGKHLLHLINDVLDLAHVESGRMTLSPEPLAIDDVIQEAVALMQPLAAQSRVTIDARPVTGSVVRGDRLRVKQVLLNLISNAIKYNRPGGRVRLAPAAAEGSHVRVVVSDSGQGIAPDSLDGLFQPFNRLGAERSAVEGTGIGLSICKRLVELMGGRIGARSSLGVGSEFWIDLPIDRLAPPPTVAVASAAARSAALSERSACVLYVEDNPANLSLVQGIVERHGNVRLIAAPSATLGFDLARSHQLDLILLDIHLPDMDGYALMRKLRDDPATRGIPVVAVTANAMPGEAGRAEGAGFADYLTKPLDVVKFDAMLRSFLDRAPT